MTLGVNEPYGLFRGMGRSLQGRNNLDSDGSVTIMGEGFKLLSD